MRGRRGLLIIVALVIVVLVVVAVFLLPRPGTTPATQGTPGTPRAVAQVTSGAPTYTPFPTLNIVVAVQNLNRGIAIPRDGVDVRAWPEEMIPRSAILAPSQEEYGDDEERYLAAIEDLLRDTVVGKRARTDILREQPILTTMLVDDLTQLARVGSDAAAVLPQGSVAVAVPMDRFTGVAYAVQAGDRVDVIVSLLFVDVDEPFQTILPNEYDLLWVNENNLELIPARPGRFENTIIGPVDVVPREDQRPRMSTQRTVQDALVVHVGEIPPDGRLFRPEEETPTPAPTVEGATQAPAATAAATEVPKRPDIVVLGVSPQDAVVLTWFIEARVPLMFALRAAGDASRVPTTPVTLDYVMSQYGINVPNKNDFAIQPPLISVRQLLIGLDLPVKPTVTGATVADVVQEAQAP